jgi:two-component system sensor histidine kinase TctE
MKTSIRLSLLKWLIIPALVINLAGVGLIYWLAWVPAQNAFDQSLAETGWDIVAHISVVDDEPVVNLSQDAEKVLRMDQYDKIFFVVKNQQGKRIFGDQHFPIAHLPKEVNKPEAFFEEINDKRIRAVSFKTIVNNTPVYIGVAETLHKRINAQSQILLTLIGLEILLISASILVLWVGISKGLHPLNRMQANLASRNHDDLSPLKDEGVPLEVLPVLNAFNGLLKKVQASASAREEFLANIAHQIRTPLAGLRTQLDWLQSKHHTDEATFHSLNLMSISTERMVRQTNQLLALARAEHRQYEKDRFDKLELNKLVEESIQFFVEEADKKVIDLGFDLQPTFIYGDRFLLRDLIDNLIDNAIRYSPQESKVTVKCYASCSFGIFQVEDSGPGIPSSERQLVFSRYYRLDNKVEGSGLGLAIVRDIARDHGAEIVLTSGENERGTIFSVRFPLAH